jgi:branched-chain amino acid transport system permease protein
VLVGGVVMGIFNFIVTDSATAWIRTVGQALSLPLLEAVDLSNSKQMIFGLSLVLLMLLKPEGLFPSAQRRAEIRGELEPDAPLEIGSLQPDPPSMPQHGRVEAGER